MALEILHKKSAVSQKLPLPSDLGLGELALNYHADGPFLTCKDTAGNIRKLNHIWVSANAPSNPTVGDAWYDINTSPGILYLYKDDVDRWEQLTQTVTTATTAAFGTVRLADAAAVANGTSGRVVDAAQLQSAISSLQMSAFKLLGTVANEAALPGGADIGDVYQAEDTGIFYFWDGSAWDNIGTLAGADGADGAGVVAGGTTGQLLAKASNNDYDTEWVDQEVINVKDFGAVGDGVADDTQAIQNAIDFALYRYDARTGKYPGWPGAYNVYDTSVYDQRVCRKVYIPAGRYKTTRVIFLGYGISESQVSIGVFQNLVIFGDGGGSDYFANAAGFGGGFSGSYIVSTNASEPCFCTQGLYRSNIEKLALIGANGAYLDTKNPGRRGDISDLDYDDTDLANWVDPDFSDPASPKYAPNANSERAPYAGICIDGYSGIANTSANANGDFDNKYPDYNYPQWILDVALKSGYTDVSQYSKAFSSEVKIIDCYINGFVVGAIASPNGTGQGEFVAFTRGGFIGNVYGISSGGQDSRLMSCYDVRFYITGTALTTVTHGNKLGKLGGVQSGCCYDVCRSIYTVNSTTTGPLVFIGCYGEHIYEIGNPGGFTGEPSLSKFINCELNFNFQVPASIRGTAPVISGAAEDNVIFEGGELALGANMLVFSTFKGPTFRDTTIRIIESGLTTFGLTPLDQMATDNEPGNPDKAWGLAAATYSQFFLSWQGNGMSERIVSRAGGNPTRFAYFQDGGQLTQIARELRHSPMWHSVPDLRAVNIDKDASYVWNFTTDVDGLQSYEGTITFANSDPFGFGLSKGDLVFDRFSETAFVVSSVSSNVITITALNNIYVPLKFAQGTNDTSLMRLKKPVDLTSGNRWAYHPVRLFSPTDEFVASITAGSNTATITRADGSQFFRAGVEIGDRLVCNASFSPFWQNAIVTDIDGDTVTFDRNARYTDDRVPVNFWIRRPYL